MKSYTDLEQSKKLAEILPIESADMCWLYANGEYFCEVKDGTLDDEDVYAWSLAALLAILPNYNIVNNGITGVVAWSLDTYSDEHQNLIDSCVDLILKLHKQNLL